MSPCQLDLTTQFAMSYPKASLFSRSALPCLVSFCLGLPLLAQYAVDTAVVSNGGGTSSAGSYVLEGTVGQTTTGTQTGGAYTLTTGFWSLITPVPTSDAPLLRVVWDASGLGAKILWATPAEGWVLQQADALAGPETQWAPVDGPYADTGTDLEVTVTAPAGQRFFRLYK